MFIRRDVFEKIGGFDEDYFIFVEETDLGWRSWLIGYRSIFCPGSVVYHLFSNTKNIVDKNTNNHLIRFHGTKNYIMTLIKNFGFQRLVYTLPIHIIIWLGLAVFLFIKGKFRSGFNILKGIWWNLVNLHKTLNKRRYIQSKRVLSDRLLFKKTMKKENMFIKFKQFLGAQKLIKTPENL
jgi:GT2 family glycosyltransferase